VINLRNLSVNRKIFCKLGPRLSFANCRTCMLCQCLLLFVLVFVEYMTVVFNCPLQTMSIYVDVFASFRLAIVVRCVENETFFSFCKSVFLNGLRFFTWRF